MGFQIGNSFSAGSWSLTEGAKRVWREIRHVYPAGGTISNMAAFKSAGKIPAGSPVSFNPENKTITILTDAVVKAATDSLQLDGFTQEDVFLNANTTVASATVVYNGELYSYMYDADVLTKLKKFAPAGITFVL